MEKREPSYTVGGYSHYGEQCGDSLKLEVELSYDPAIPLLGIQLRKPELKETHVARCSLQHFTIAGTWKQPRCPLADKWIRKLWYIYAKEYYSAVKKKKKKNTFESVLVR